MRKLTEIVVVVVGTALMFILWAVLSAVLVLPITLAAAWWLGSSIDLLAHPRRNALVLGVVFLIAGLIRTFNPPPSGSRADTGHAWWRN